MLTIINSERTHCLISAVVYLALTTGFTIPVHAQENDVELIIDSGMSQNEELSFANAPEPSFSQSSISDFMKTYEVNDKARSFEIMDGECKKKPAVFSKKEQRYGVYERNQRKKANNFSAWNEAYLKPKKPIKFELKENNKDCSEKGRK